MIETVDIFPSKFFSYKIADQELLQKIYNEVYQKREQIKGVSWATQSQSTDVYITDYSNTVKIESFHDAIRLLIDEMNQNGILMKMVLYWTSLYKNTAVHPMHNHYVNILQPYNYSGILYLTNSGSTDFFSNNPSSFEQVRSVESDAGRFILFPSSIPHQVSTTLESDQERCVIAFNCELRQS